jgi:uncharacterized protein YndB with AHSA1/START domain
MELLARISIKRSPDEVWDFFTNPDNWKDWWGGALTKVEPRWEKGATLEWEMGRPSTILNLTLAKEIEIQNIWSSATWYFTKESGDSTLLEYKERFTGGASMDPRTWQTDTASTLAKLKRCIESKPLPKKQSSKTNGPAGSEHVSWFQRLFGKG